MALISLDDFNEQRAAEYPVDWTKPLPNGIACPDCGKEMVDADPNVTLMYSPPRKRIECPNCGYAGLRVA